MNVYAVENSDSIYSAIAIVIAGDEIEALLTVQNHINKINLDYQNGVGGERCFVFFNSNPIKINLLPCFAEGDSKVIAYHEDGG